MEKYQNLKDKKVLILGFSTTGCAAAVYFNKLGANVFVSEFSERLEKNNEKIDELEKLGIKIEFSKHSDEFINNSEFCVLSPSIPPEADILKRLDEKNIPYFSDIEYIGEGSGDFCGIIAAQITGKPGQRRVRGIHRKISQQITCGIKTAYPVAIVRYIHHFAGFSNILFKHIYIPCGAFALCQPEQHYFKQHDIETRGFRCNHIR